MARALVNLCRPGTGMIRTRPVHPRTQDARTEIRGAHARGERCLAKPSLELVSDGCFARFSSNMAGDRGL